MKKNRTICIVCKKNVAICGDNNEKYTNLHKGINYEGGIRKCLGAQKDISITTIPQLIEYYEARYSNTIKYEEINNNVIAIDTLNKQLKEIKTILLNLI